MIPLEQALPEQSKVRRRLAVVVSVESGTCTIDLGGTEIEEVPYVRGAGLSPDDNVHVLQDGGSLLVLGAQA